jgi:50S ribosomal subunit-associated GTPase HflX
MKEVPILLVSNKIDLRDSEEGQKQSAKFVSQKEGENLAQVFFVGNKTFNNQKTNERTFF